MAFEGPLLKAIKDADRKWEADRKRRDAARLRHNERRREKRRKEAKS